MIQAWAAKRICKFLLKRLIGKFIKGELDFDRLEVQLNKNTSFLQLNNLPLNVDYINEQLDLSSFVVQEGFIGRISIKIPWKILTEEKCDIELEELELVLVPRTDFQCSRDSEECSTSQSHHRTSSSSLDREHIVQNVMQENVVTSAFGGIHDGVKMIARMMERLLLGLHVRIKNLIIVFEPESETYSSNLNLENNCQSHSVLAFRVAQVEYGTNVLGENSHTAKGQQDQLMEFGILTKKITFEGATVDLYPLEGKIVKQGTVKPFVSVLTGGSLESQIDGFGGSINLSIPWKSGCMHIAKVDADICITPIMLQLHPSTLQKLVSILQSIDKYKSRDFVPDSSSKPKHGSAKRMVFDLNSLQSASLGGSVISDTMFRSCTESFADVPPSAEDTADSSLIPDSMIISNWVRNANLGESVSEFFECWDGTRGIQAGSTDSSLQSLTYSVFGAITAASTLASGSVPFTSREQQVEYNLNLRLDGISVIVFFEDNVPSPPVDLNDNLEEDLKTNASAGSASDCLLAAVCSNVEYKKDEEDHLDASECFLEFNVSKLRASFQISKEDVRFRICLQNLNIWEYLSQSSMDERKFTLLNSEKNFKNVCSVSNLQRTIEDILPEFPVSLHSSTAMCKRDPRIGVDKLPSLHWVAKKGKAFEGEKVHSSLRKFVKVKILSSETDFHDHFSVDCHIACRRESASTFKAIEFEMQLPCFVLWLDVYAANKIWLLNKNFKLCSRDVAMGSGERISERFSDTQSDHSHILIKGRVFLPSGRVIFCFPENIGDNVDPFVLKENFVCLDISFPSCNKDGIHSGDMHFPSSGVICMNVGECALFLVSPVYNHHVDKLSECSDKILLFCQKVLSFSRGPETDFPLITLQWQPGPQMEHKSAERAWEKAKAYCTSGKGGGKFEEDNSEFIAVATAGVPGGSDSQDREHIINNSSLFLHLSLAHVEIELHEHEHVQVINLLNALQDCIFNERKKQSVYSGDTCLSDVLQFSVLLEFKVFLVSLSLVDSLCIKASMEKELPGTWTGFQLKVKNFECLSVSNLGGIAGSKHLWLNHNEGTLHGSLTDKMQLKNICLIICENSVSGRGDGGNTIPLTHENTGSTIIYFDKPNDMQSLTSITVRYATLIAPGGRLDWISSIVSYFTQSTQDDNLTDFHNNSTTCDNSYCTYFSLKLVDTAVSYEPFLCGLRLCKFSTSDTHVSDGAFSETVSPVACILAASSLNLTTLSNENVNEEEYTIVLHDVGLLLLDLSKQKTSDIAYDALSLEAQGYVKVAGEALMKIVLQMNSKDGLSWKIISKRNHIFLDTCHDTAIALIRLVTQLQKLFTPDYVEYMVHLETKNNSNKHTRTLNGKDGSTVLLYVEKDCIEACARLEDTAAGGLMDSVVEDFFTSRAKVGQETCAVKTSISKHSAEPISQDSCALNSMLGFSLSSMDHSKCKGPAILDKMDGQVVHEKIFPLIEDYCFQQSEGNGNLRQLKAQERRDKDDLGIRGGWYTESSFQVVENHLTDLERMQDKTKGSQRNSGKFDICERSFQLLVAQISLEDLHVTWRLNAGSDWPETTYICSTSQAKAETSRNSTMCLEVELNGASIQYDIFPDDGIYASKLSISVHDIYIFDRSEHAPWKKILLDYHSKMHPRESSAKALRVELEAVRPEPSIPLEEYRLHLKMLPLRLHLARSQLDFFINFFSHRTSLIEEPSVDRQQFSDNSSPCSDMNEMNDGLLPFFQKCKICPLMINISYVPEHFDLVALGGGNYAELLNIVPLKDIKLHLKGIETSGVHGWNNLSEIVIGNWLEDIAQNQVHKMLKGVPPIRSLLALVHGVAKLVSAPTEHYRKDRRLISGLQRGMIGFVRSLSLEAVGCGLHLAAGAHGILTTTESTLASISPSFSFRAKENLGTAVRVGQPANACQGLRQACENVAQGLGRTATTLIGKPLKSYVRGEGAQHAIATAIQGAPAAVLTPVSLAAGAVHSTLLGVRNSLDPDQRKESEEKHSGCVPVI